MLHINVLLTSKKGEGQISIVHKEQISQRKTAHAMKNRGQNLGKYVLTFI